MIAKQTVYLNEAKTKAVPDGDPSARFLLVREGHDVEPALVDKYEGAGDLVSSAPKQKKESAPAPSPSESQQAAVEAAKKAEQAKAAKPPKAVKKTASKKKAK